MSKIIQISDTHIVPEGQLAYGQVDTGFALEQTITTINRLLPAIGPVDAVVVTGDLTDFGTLEEYARFKHLMAPLSVPFLALPGNHDDREVMRNAFAMSDWMPADGPIQWSLNLDSIYIVGLDSLVAGAPHGALSNAGITYLEQALKTANGKPVIVAFHHPPILTGLHPMDRQNLLESGPLERIIADYNGDIRLICGHVHRAIAGQSAGRLCLTAPGTSHAVTIDQRLGASNSLTLEPGGFMLHEWRDALVSHTIPVGGFDGPYPFHQAQ